MTPWTAAHQAFLSISNTQSLLKLRSIKSVMPSNNLILCYPLLLMPSISLSIRVFSNEPVLHTNLLELSNLRLEIGNDHDCVFHFLSCK